MPQTTFLLRPAPPFRLDLTAWTLRRRPANEIDRWDGETYRRVLQLRGRLLEVAVSQIGNVDKPRLEVAVSGAMLTAAVKSNVKAALERMLGLRVDLSGFYRQAAGDPKLNPLVQRFRGVKPPRFPTSFEALANAIACQQITLTQGIVLLNRLAEAYGAPFCGGRAFPSPAQLERLDAEQLRRLGFSRQKGLYLTEAAHKIEAGELDPGALEELDNSTALSRLLALKGVGRWTAEYVLLRGLGRLDVFPGDDVGARKNLERWLGLAEPLDYAGVSRIVARWQPYAGLIYFHLLLGRLEAAGHLQAAAEPAARQRA